jgi:UDP-N-acetylglucosamine 4,6-dehydratase
VFKNKILLITGGTGSFGEAVVKKFIDSPIKEIRIFSRDEKKQDDMRHKWNNDKLKFYIGDVRDYNSIEHALQGVDYVFSAAALKQVPSCEFYPIEAIKTNVLGADNVIRASINNNVKKVICLSTDKAVYPINAMGMTKALMEKVMVAIASSLLDTSTIICGTRYGNVMATRGSVIPLFIKQIKENKSITITDPEMKRFMMSLDEALNLVFYAYKHGRQGDLFVQKSPAATIRDIATALKIIFKSNAPILIIGTRHSEKQYESLVSQEEMSRAEDLGNYYRIVPDVRGLNYEKYFEKGQIKLYKYIDYTAENTYQLSVDELVEMLPKLDEIKTELEI